MNKKLLRSKMALYGDTGNELAEALEITPQTLSGKINEKNGASFTKPEMEKIKKRYLLSDEEFLQIFFADVVSKKDTEASVIS